MEIQTANWQIQTYDECRSGIDKFAQLSRAVSRVTKLCDNILSVGNIIEDIRIHHTQAVRVEGYLYPDLHGAYIARRKASSQAEVIYNRAIHIYMAPGTKIKESVFNDLSGSKVVAQGICYDPYAGIGACGHINLWAAEIAINSIQRYDSFQTHPGE